MPSAKGCFPTDQFSPSWMRKDNTMVRFIALVLLPSRIPLNLSPSSSIIENIKESCTGYAYFFFDSRNSDQTLIRYENLMLSLLSQAAYRLGKIPDALRDMYKSHGSGREHPSLKSLRDTLQRVINEYDNFYIMIDSLDECGDRVELLDWIHFFSSSKMERCHLLFTSRLEPDIIGRLSSVTRIKPVNIEGLAIRRDISEFVDKRLLLIKTWNKMTKELVKITLVDGADGMCACIP